MAAPLRRVLPKLATFGLRKLAQSLWSSEGGVPRTRFNANVSAKTCLGLGDTGSGPPWKQIKGMVAGSDDQRRGACNDRRRDCAVICRQKDELPEKSLVSMAPVNTRQEGAERTTNTISILRFSAGHPH